MANINLSAAVRSNLSSLQNTASLMSKTSDRLSTGNKVNSALDNPTNFFTASSLNSRAGDLNQLMDSMANGIKTIEAADNGLTAITKNLESMQSTLRQARQDKSFQTESLSMKLPATVAGNEKLKITGGQLGDTATSLDLTKTEYRATVESTAFTATDAKSFTLNGKTINIGANATKADAIKLINDAGAGVTASDGTTGIVLTANSTDGKILIENVNQTGTQLGFTEDLFEKGAAKVTANAVFDGATDALDADTELTINNIKINLKQDMTLQQVVGAINDAGVGVTASVGTNTDADKLVLTGDTDSAFTLGTGATALGFLGTQAVKHAPTSGSVAATAKQVAKSVDDLVNDIASNPLLEGKVRASNDNGKLRIENLSTRELSVGGVSSTGNVDGTSSGSKKIAGNEVRADLAKQYNELRDQLDKLADDGSFNGINLLRGDNLKLTFNENGTSSIEIQAKGGKAINAGNLKLETSLDAVDLDTDEGIDAFLDQIKGALNTVRSQASAFGSNLSIVQNRQDFTKSMINTLETGAGNLTLADMNQEAANMMALQTRQSLASSTLSMANQADQGVLQLLR